MSDIAIKVENLSKLYQLGEVGTGTISKDLNRWWARMRGKEDPYVKIGQANDRTKKAESDFVWALKEINFEVKQGEVLGIIGRNGAGKSTLLKILSKITSPTTGKIYSKGRIASLLEVGTGFHPEMTGRENIYLNGAILGMRKWEIDKKFDEIVDFAGVEAYINTPVKRYSSGMYVRLAFAVAAFLDPEILIVDEVLAVGDAEFQKKCLGRLKDVSVNDGRTVLFVSHNMEAITALTKRTIVFKNGEVNFDGNSIESVNFYHDFKNQTLNNNRLNKLQSQTFIKSIDLPDRSIEMFSLIIIYLKIKNKSANKKFRIGLAITDITQKFLYHGSIITNLETGLNNLKVEIGSISLIPGEYQFTFSLIDLWNISVVDTVIGYPSFSIIANESADYDLMNWKNDWGKHCFNKINLTLIKNEAKQELDR